MKNKEFVKALNTIRSKFSICDFHFHSPASYDVKSKDLKGVSTKLSECLATIDVPTTLTAENLKKYEQEVLKKYPPKDFLDDILARRSEVADELGLTISDDWAVVAITDHNVCQYSSETAKEAWPKRAKNRLIVLPGIELDVEFPVNADRKISTARAHVLLLFRPLSTAGEIQTAINVAADGSHWKEGANDLRVDSLHKFVNALRNSPHNPAICIAAHVGSSKGVQKEVKEALRLLSPQNAEIARLEQLLNQAEQDDQIQQLQAELKQLRESSERQVSDEVLKEIGRCGFDSLQVASSESFRHYRKLHRRGERDLGRSTLVVSSDAHNPCDLFSASGYIPHIKLPDDTFKLNPEEFLLAIRKSLLLAETRFAFRPTGRPEYWIEGLMIRQDASDARQFWKKANPQIFTFSRNLSCVIGGRGSGKSALLDAIAFAAKSEDYTDKNSKEDYFERSAELLKGNEVRVCWKYAGSPPDTSCRKGLFVSRYFGDTRKLLAPTKTDIEERSAEAIKPPPIEIYRFRELEAYAEGENLRNLIDRISNATSEAISAEIQSLARQLEDQRDTLLELCEEIYELTQDSSPLRTYIERYLKYKESNTREIASTLNQYDLEKAALDTIEETSSAFGDLDIGGDVDEMLASLEAVRTEIPLPEAGGEVPKPISKLLKLFDLDDEKSPAGSLRAALSSVSKRAGTLKQRIEVLETESRNALNKTLDKLREQGMPQGTKDREQRKADFDEAQQVLRAYRRSWAKLEKLLKDRAVMFESLEELAERRTKERQKACDELNQELSNNLDPSVLLIEVTPGSAMDKDNYLGWLEGALKSGFSQLRATRAEAVVNKRVMPRDLKEALLSDDESSFVTSLENDFSRAANGRITREEAERVFSGLRPICRYEIEACAEELQPAQHKDIPKELLEGVRYCPLSKTEEGRYVIDEVLMLDEVILDDKPQVLMNDRPLDSNSQLRSLDKLSPGQRCSAILPIILLNGAGPILIDQPEDNLDNRLIREVLVNVLSTMKLRRQVIVATHNPNFPVLGDAEQIYTLQATDENSSLVIADGSLDQVIVSNAIMDVMEGGREAFQYREAVYSTHWSGVIDGNQDGS